MSSEGSTIHLLLCNTISLDRKENYLFCIGESSSECSFSTAADRLMIFLQMQKDFFLIVKLQWSLQKDLRAHTQLGKEETNKQKKNGNQKRDIDKT